MNKRRVMVALCVMVLATSAVAMNSSARSALSSLGRRAGVLNEGSTEQRQKAARNNASPQPAAAQGQPSAAAQTPAADIPKHVLYGLLFRERAHFKKRAQEQESKGGNGAFFREFHKKKLELTDAETAALDRVADEANREVTRLDKQARKIIDDARAQHPKGLIKEGESLPTPPAELAELEKQRTAALLQAREQLRAALGDAEFQRMEALLLKDAAERMKAIFRGGPAASLTEPLQPAGGTSTKG